MSVRPSTTSHPLPFSFREWPVAVKTMTALIGVIVLVSFALAIVVGQNYSQIMLNRDLQGLEQTSHVKALQLVSNLTRDTSVLQRFAGTNAAISSLHEPSPSDTEKVFAPLRQDIPEIEAAALVSNTGEVDAFFTSLPTLAPPNPAKWPWFSALETMPEDAVLIGGGPDAGLAGINGIHFSTPVTDASSGKVIGVLYVVVDPQRYGAGSNSTDVEILLSDGTRLGGWLGLPDNIKGQVLSSGSGSVLSNTTYPPPVAYGYVHINSLGVDYLPAGQLDWIVAAPHPYQTILADIQTGIDRLNSLIAVSALVLCLSVIGICYLFYLPMKRLAAAAGQIAITDDYAIPLPRDPASDLVAFSDGLQSLLDRLKHRATQLQTAAAVSRESITQDVESLLTRIANLLRKQMGLYAVYMYRMEPDGLRAYVEVAEGDPAVITQRSGNWIILSGKSLVGQAMQRNELQWAQGRIAAFPGASDQPAEIVIPFQGGGLRAIHIVGEPEGFNQFDVNIFRLIASEIGSTLENHQLLEDVESARNEAERANRVKSQFLASVSHELRTPLNSIINFTRFVQRGVMGPVTGEQDEALGKVLTSGRHLLNLINDVLDISKIEADALELFIEPNISLHELLAKSVPIAQNLLVDKQVVLRTDIDSALPHIAADAQRVLQIILNILSNACKFTEQGSIVVSAHQHNDEVIIAVKDTGPGIAPEETEAVFETFRQTEAGLKRGGGTGLGMPISRRLAEAHGGRLWLESDLGKGTTFFVALPIQSPLLTSISN